MSQQQNPPTVPQMDSENKNTEADVKPFSIRQYAFASRQKNIFNSWPFPEKFLHMCLNHGIKDVLPPLDGCSNLMHLQDDSKDVNVCKAEVPHLIEHPQNIKNECHLMSNGEKYKVTNHNSSHEEGNQHNCSISVNLCQSADAIFTLPSSTDHVHKSSPTTLASCKAMIDKRKRHRGRCKKRSMADILAVARHCTLEEINRMYKFCYSDTVIEGCQQMVPSQNISKL